MRTIVYIDGFNLFYGCLKKTPYKWLDLKALFTSLLNKDNNIVEIKYFTAIVKETTGNEGASQRQLAYIRALEKTIPEISVHYGHFLRHQVKMANVNPPPNIVEVFKTEEKGSDVNLAVHLLNDAWLNKYDCAVVVSNDSDMAEAIKLVKEHHPKKVIGIVTPGEKTRTSEQLKEHANFVRKIRNSFLKKCQLSKNIPDSNIFKPHDWK